MPLLAGLVAYADRDRNLDLIRDEPLDSWIHQFWLCMFQDYQITQHHYRSEQAKFSLRIPLNIRAIPEIIVWGWFEALLFYPHHPQLNLNFRPTTQF